MKVLRELLDQGLVTARDPILLAPGELQRADECYYKDNNPALVTVPGRTTFGTTQNGGVGLAHMGIDGAADQILALSGDTLYAASFTGTTGTLAGVASGLTTDGATLSVVQDGPDAYVLTGVNANQRLTWADGAVQVRAQGLQPVASAPTVTVLGSGTWSSSPFLGNGVYWFLSTEVLHPGEDDELESTFLASPAFGSITSYTNQSIQVTFPAQVNANATHRYLYIAERQADTTSEPSLLLYRRTQGPIDMATTSVTLTGTLATDGPRSPGFAADVTGQTAWTDRDNVLTDNGMVATCDVTTTADRVVMELGNFAISPGLNGAAGLQVTVVGSYTTDSGASYKGLTVEMYQAGVFTARRKVPLTTANAAWTVGGVADLWGTTWDAGDLADGIFSLRLVAVGTGIAGATHTISVDHVRVTTTLGGNFVLVTGDAFPAVSLQPAFGPPIAFPAYGPPPKSTTGDVFNGCLVLNDVNDPNSVKYSLPGKPEYFPAPYAMDVQDATVTCIRRMGSTLIVGTLERIKRLTFLPFETDVFFDTGSAWEDVTRDHGMPGPQCATTVTLPDRGLVLAYVTTQGMSATDGLTCWPLTNDLDWATTVTPTSLSGAVLVNYPALHLLILYYPETGQTENTKALYFHYHASHLKDGGALTVTGPVTVAAVGATVATLTCCPKLFTLSADGTVSLEDQGQSAVPPLVRTRRIAMNYPGGEAKIDRTWLRATARAGTLDTAAPCTVTVRTQATGGAVKTRVEKNITVSGTQLVGMDTIVSGEMFEWEMTRSGTAEVQFAHLSYPASDYLLEEHGSA